MADSPNKLKTLVGNIEWKAVFAPSTIGVIVGFLIGLIRKIMIGADAPLHVIQDAASLIGEGAIPTLTLILGANLLKGLQGSRMQKSIIFWHHRRILIVKGALRFGFIPPDPLYRFVFCFSLLCMIAANFALKFAGVITQLL